MDNPIRLEMLHSVMLSSHPVSVSDISTAVNAKESVSSQYLRILNMQGFIVAKRSGKNVFYERRRDGAKEFMRLVDELASMFEHPDWKERVLAVLPAFSNARKTAILSELNKGGAISVELLAERSFMPIKTCYRIIGELTALGFVKFSADATIFTVIPKDRFTKAFLDYAAINSHKL